MKKVYDIFDSIKSVVDNSKHVLINTSNLKKVVPLLKNQNKVPWLNNDYLDIDNCTVEEQIRFMLLSESLNFCYWGNPKWKIEYKGKWYSGSYGLFYGLAKAAQNGYNILNLEYLENITFDELDSILTGTTEIPLLKERYHIIKQLVKEIKNIDSVYNLFLQATSDKELLAIIVDNFQNFRDISVYNDKPVYFFKRATLLVEDLYQNIPEIRANIKSNNGLYGCADYKIPQVLRELGILEYSDKLKKIIDNEKTLEHDSNMEIEIRANMLYAIELIKEELNKNGISMNSIEIDNALWLLSKKDDWKSKPHHLTRTIYY